MSALPSSSTSTDEYLNEQLSSCLAQQNNVLQSLTQYSQLIRLQLFEIKHHVETVSSNLAALQYRQQANAQPTIPMHLHPSLRLVHPSLLLRPPFPAPAFTATPDPIRAPTPPLSFSRRADAEPSRAAPFVFDMINSSPFGHHPSQEDEEDGVDEPTINFKPIVHLQPVETKTGEENEDILFCERAKLYRFDPTTNEMKERGLGEMKILQHRSTHLCRVVMRREQVLKVCANHRITSAMALKKHQGSETAYVWSAMDSTDDVAKHETFCVRFKTTEQARSFAQAFQAAQVINEEQRNALPSIDKIRLPDDDVTIISELVPTREQIERARRFQLPPTFYLYESKAPCSGCRGCREDLAALLSEDVVPFERLNSHQATALLENLISFPSGFFPNASLPSLMSMLPALYPEDGDSYPQPNTPSPPRDRRMIIKAKRSLPSNRPPPPPTASSSFPDSPQLSSPVEEPAVVQAHQKKSRNLSGNTTQTFSLERFASQLTENILHRAKQELVKQLQIVTIAEDASAPVHTDNTKPSIFSTSLKELLGSSVPSKAEPSGFSFAGFGQASPSSPHGFLFSTPSAPATTTTPSTLFAFGNKPTVSFAQLTTQQWTSDSSKPSLFAGHGSLVFSAGATDDKDDAEDPEEPYEPTCQFKPIVHLQPVETKTGEENEDILFCERAKLYRFDPTTNEMKERGLGEMKILQHRSTHLCRVVMRREQVLKVCANHRITTEMDLKEHQGKENAYVWSATDYADGVPKRETLCIRFKTKDQATRFFDQFNEAKQINGNNQQ